MKIATMVLSILDTAAAIAMAVIIFKYSDDAFFGLDTFLMWAIPILALITALPAFALAVRGGARKSALALAIAFPFGVAGLLVGVFLYFTYVI